MPVRGLVGNIYLGASARAARHAESAFIDIGLARRLPHVADIWEYRQAQHAAAPTPEADRKSCCTKASR